MYHTTWPGSLCTCAQTLRGGLVEQVFECQEHLNDVDADQPHYVTTWPGDYLQWRHLVAIRKALGRKGVAPSFLMSQVNRFYRELLSLSVTQELRSGLA